MSDYSAQIHIFSTVSGPTLRIVDPTSPNKGGPHRPESFSHAAAELISPGNRILFTTQTPGHVAVSVPENVRSLSELRNAFGGAKPESWRYVRPMTQHTFRLLLERLLALTEGCPVPGTVNGSRRDTLSVHGGFRRNSIALAGLAAVASEPNELNASAMRMVNLLGAEAETAMRLTVLRDDCIPRDPARYEVRAFSQLGAITMSHAELLDPVTKQPKGKAAGAARWQHFHSFRPKAEALKAYLSGSTVDGQKVSNWQRV